MMIKSIANLALALAAALGAQSSFAEVGYRADSEPVMEPMIRGSAAPTRDADFAAAYKAAGSPKLIFFWNRALTDDVQDPQQVVEVYSYFASLGLVTARSVRRQDAGKVDNPPPPQVDLRIRSGFQSVIRANQLRLVDRNLAIRMANKKTKDVEDRQTNETRALDTKARLLIEATVVEDKQSSSGAGLQMKAVDIQSGVILAEIYYTGEPMPGQAAAPTRYVALANGGYQAVSEQVPLSDFGREAAELLLQEMTPALRTMRAPMRR